MTKAPTDATDRGALFRRRPERAAPDLQGLPSLDQAPKSGEALRRAREALTNSEQKLAEARLRESDAKAALADIEKIAPQAFAEGDPGIAEKVVVAERAAAIAAKAVQLASKLVEQGTEAVEAAEADARAEVDAIAVALVRDGAAQFQILGGAAAEKLEELRRLKEAAFRLGLPSARFWDLGDCMCTKDGLGLWGKVNGLARAPWDGPPQPRRLLAPLARVRVLRRSISRSLTGNHPGEVVTVPKSDLGNLVRAGIVETVDEADRITPETVALAARDEWKGDPEAPNRVVRFTKIFRMKGLGTGGAIPVYGPGDVAVFRADLAEKIVNIYRAASYEPPALAEAQE